MTTKKLMGRTETVKKLIALGVYDSKDETKGTPVGELRTELANAEKKSNKTKTKVKANVHKKVKAEKPEKKTKKVKAEKPEKKTKKVKAEKPEKKTKKVKAEKPEKKTKKVKAETSMTRKEIVTILRAAGIYKRGETKGVSIAVMEKKLAKLDKKTLKEAQKKIAAKLDKKTLKATPGTQITIDGHTFDLIPTPALVLALSEAGVYGDEEHWHQTLAQLQLRVDVESGKKVKAGKKVKTPVIRRRVTRRGDRKAA